LRPHNAGYLTPKTGDLVATHDSFMNIESLNDISKALESHMQNQEARVYAFVETGYDETGMVATADGYLRFAKELIDFVVAAHQGRCDICSYGEIEGPCDSSVGDVFSSISDVELDSAMLVRTEDEAEQAIRYFQQDSPPE
jgi:hypothetical protein